MVTSGEREREEGQYRGRGLRGTIMYKISYKGILYSTENIENIR